MTNLPALAEALRERTGSRIGVGVADPTQPCPPLWPEEHTATSRMIDKRRREFGAGRAAARAAMANLGLPAQAVPMQKDRAPHWPTGLAGSISHCACAAVALVARKDTTAYLGIDIEQDKPLDTDLWADVLTQNERDWLMNQPESGRAKTATRLFCVKEAVYKAQYPLTGRVLTFAEVSVTLEDMSFRAQLSQVSPLLPAVFTGHILSIDDLIVSFVVGPTEALSVSE